MSEIEGEAVICYIYPHPTYHVDPAGVVGAYYVTWASGPTACKAATEVEVNCMFASVTE